MALDLHKNNQCIAKTRTGFMYSLLYRVRPVSLVGINQEDSPKFDPSHCPLNV